MLKKYLSPEQIAGQLKTMDTPSLRDAYVCKETIYTAIYALPVGQLRHELIHCLRHGRSQRKPRTGGIDRRDGYGRCGGVQCGIESNVALNA